MRGTCHNSSPVIHISEKLSKILKQLKLCLTNLNVWQAQEVLGDVNNNLVHERGSNVKSIHVVIKVESGESKDRDPSDMFSKKKKKKERERRNRSW
jgi:hypothetical protein